MSYKGFVQNGVVIFAEPVQLAPGTEVRIEPVAPSASGFWESPSLEDLLRRQGVMPAGAGEQGLGGWPEDELDDGFEDAVASWRARELEWAP